MDRAEPVGAMTPIASASAAPHSRGDRVARWILAAALLLGLLRFVRLSTWSLWIDESLTWTDAHHGIVGGEIQNPLGYRLIEGTVALLGGVASEFSLRILPAVAGWACIPVAYCAFHTLFGSRRAAVASLLVAVSSWHLYWSQSARFYSLAQLTTLLGAWVLLSALTRGSVLKALLGLALAAAGALFHPSSVLLLPALSLGPFFLGRIGRPIAFGSELVARVLLAVGILGALISAGWLFKAWDTYAYQKGHEGLSAAASSVAHFVKTTGFFVTPLLATGVLVGTWFAFTSRRGADMFAVLLVVCAIVLAFFAAAFVRVSAQYVFVVLPWIALVAALPVGSRGEHGLGRRGEAAWILVLTLPALVTSFLYLTVRRGERPPWREAYQYVASARTSGDQIFGMAAPVGEFYLAPQNTDLRRPTALASLDLYRARLPEHWAAKGRRQWFVVNPEDFAGWGSRDAADFQRFLREECRLDAVWPLYVESRDLSVWVYVRD